MTAVGERARTDDVLARFRDAVFCAGDPATADLRSIGSRLRQLVLNGRLRQTMQALADDTGGRFHVTPIFAAPILRHGAFRMALVYVVPDVDLGVAGGGLLLRDHAEDALFVVASESRLRVMHYRQPAPRPHDVLDPSKTLVTEGVKVYGRGDCVFMTAGETVLDFLHADAPAVLVAVFSEPVHNVSWGYDPATLSPAKMYQATLRDTRVRYALEIVLEFSDVWKARGDGLVDSVETLTGHPSHAVRWSALRALDALDSKRGTIALRRALDDPHPHLAQVAREALA